MGMRLIERIHRLADNLTGLLGNRLDLFGLEVQEETERLLGNLVVLLALFVFAAFALFFATVALLVFAASSGCLLAVAIGVASAYGLLAVACGVVMWRRQKEAHVPFAATRAEFERDRMALCRRPEDET
ncbi:MAG: putative Actinobacterial Holin-X, holin superfamily [Proteobacteria bacterium]|jgi:uncharacterized membrane protein YqjE|nr:putative Actinobacterial Holin-X, holin superfamily [Pseudomonadota bacterium]